MNGHHHIGHNINHIYSGMFYCRLLRLLIFPKSLCKNSKKSGCICRLNSDQKACAFYQIYLYSDTLCLQCIQCSINSSLQSFSSDANISYDEPSSFSSFLRSQLQPKNTYLLTFHQMLPCVFFYICLITGGSDGSHFHT